MQGLKAKATKMFCTADCKYVIQNLYYRPYKNWYFKSATSIHNNEVKNAIYISLGHDIC